MNLSVILAFVCFFAAVVADRPHSRGILSNIIGNIKPGGKPEAPSIIITDPHHGHDGHNGHDDDCPRMYPLTPPNDQQVPFAFKRYGISPNITDPPESLLEVRLEKISTFDRVRRINENYINIADTLS